MYLFEDIGKLLDEIVDELPAPLLDRLNGGINLVYESKHNEKIPSSDYWVLGEYCCDSLGRRVYIYYGSFMAMYIDASPAQIKKKLREVVLHELRHHVEGLCGVRDLAIEDDVFVQKALAQLGEGPAE